jgi:hypothetical protein
MLYVRLYLIWWIDHTQESRALVTWHMIPMETVNLDISLWDSCAYLRCLSCRCAFVSGHQMTSSSPIVSFGCRIWNLNSTIYQNSKIQQKNPCTHTTGSHRKTLITSSCHKRPPKYKLFKHYRSKKISHPLFNSQHPRRVTWFDSMPFLFIAL